MSNIGEARAFRKAAEDLRKRAEQEKDPTWKAVLERQAAEAEVDARVAWAEAGQEAGHDDDSQR